MHPAPVKSPIHDALNNNRLEANTVKAMVGASTIVPLSEKMPAQPKIAILLCTYCGKRHLPEQLDSFTTQTHQNWEVWASDDGSTDGTLETLTDYKQKWATKLFVQSGPAQGFAANFLSLIRNADIHADYYAFSDQDDIWEPDKLERAVHWFKTIPSDIPALYCSRTRLINEDGREIGLSPLYPKPPSFANALVQNISGGNTMIFNHAARVLLQEVGARVSPTWHDWWGYLVVTGCGGKVFYDSTPSTRYRQHANNLLGTNGTWKARIQRIRMLGQGHFREWNSKNIAALSALRDKLTPENQKTLIAFARARDMSLIPRLIGLKQCGIHRQTTLGNLGLVAAAIFKKL